MNLLAALRAHRLLAIVRGSDPDAALTTVLTLAEEGVTLIEVSLSGRDALDVIARARTALGPDATLGAGTVLSSDDARAAQKAGCRLPRHSRGQRRHRHRAGTRTPRAHAA